MKRISDYIDHIDNELHDAKVYSENYLYAKARNYSENAAKWKEIANDELKHAMYLHDMVVEEIDILSRIYTPTQDMLKMWDESHEKYVEKSAWIRQMLTM